MSKASCQTLKQLPKEYNLKITNPEKTGLRLIETQNEKTGTKIYFAEFNKDFDVHATVAWAGARTSRSSDTYEDIFTEITEAFRNEKYSAGEKLANVFVNYGHASVADMSPVMLYMNHIPMHQAAWIFNHTSVGAGQELSTRYVQLDELGIPEIEKFIDLENLNEKDKEKIKKYWKEIPEAAAKEYKKWYPKVRKPLEEFLKKHAKKVAESTINARTLDIVRMWIPFGSDTSMTLLTSTRSWIDLVIQLRAEKDPYYKELGEQICSMLNIKKYAEGQDIMADLGGMTLFSEGKFTIRENLKNLEEYLKTIPEYKKLVEKSVKSGSNYSEVKKLNIDELEGEAPFMQYMLMLHPSLDEKDAMEFLRKLNDEEKSRVGEIILNRHDHHDLMRNAGDVRGITYTLKTALAYVRDLNRHRAMGRFIPTFETDNWQEILNEGFNKNYQLHETECLQHLEGEWTEDMKKHYEKLNEFYDFVKEKLPEQDMNFIKNLLPLGHQVKLHMSGPVTQYNYMSSLRISLGGDYGYRNVVWQILEQLRENPFLSKMLPKLEKPDPNNVKQILGRS